jgi:uncharacterized protein (TIGR00290 family)
MNRTKALIAWSSGKDSAWALHEARRSDSFEIVGALTTVTESFDRVSMHGVRRELLMAQLDAAGLRGIIVSIPFPCTNEVYEAAMARAMADAKAHGVTHVIFGDLFLDDVRAYREARLAEIGLTAAFPLWRRPTAALAEEMIEGGLQARLATVDLRKLPASFSGRAYDREMLAALPMGIDPCGENGEFHSFAFAGPMFRRSIDVRVGTTVERNGYAYTDLMVV